MPPLENAHFSATTLDKRTAARRRVLKAGTIEFGGGAIDCTVRNPSSSGAALDVTSPIGIPERFNLIIAADEFRKACRVIWRMEK